MTKLKRTISWKVLSLYGLGNILGAGIYVLVGEVATESGDGLVWSFILAGAIASFTALSYSALASKYPVSAGAAVYTQRAFKSKALSTLIGLSLAATGVISASALLRGFDKYFQNLLQSVDIGISSVPSPIVILGLLFILALISFKGMKESAYLAVILTLLEAGGLLLIIVFAGFKGDVGSALSTSTGALTTVEPMAILLGTFLAFYAFIGFEDMVNVAEEVKEPKISLRKGMLTALIVATILYIATAIASLSVLSSAELANSDAPLATVFEVVSGSSLPVITLIGLFAVTNGVLAQIIMSSRVLYGLAREGWLPEKLSQVSKKNKTPTLATLVSIIAIAIGAILLPLGTLAKITSFGLLIIFSIVQLSAFRLIYTNNLKLHKVIPVLGFLTNIGVIAIQILSWTGAI